MLDSRADKINYKSNDYFVFSFHEREREREREILHLCERFSGNTLILIISIFETPVPVPGCTPNQCK